jgi:hypothetical protein
MRPIINSKEVMCRPTARSVERPHIVPFIRTRFMRSYLDFRRWQADTVIVNNRTNKKRALAHSQLADTRLYPPMSDRRISKHRCRDNAPPKSILDRRAADKGFDESRRDGCQGKPGATMCLAALLAFTLHLTTSTWPMLRIRTS